MTANIDQNSFSAVLASDLQQTQNLFNQDQQLFPTANASASSLPVSSVPVNTFSLNSKEIILFGLAALMLLVVYKKKVKI